MRGLNLSFQYVGSEAIRVRNRRAIGLVNFWPCSHELIVDTEVPRRPAKIGWLTPNDSRVFLTSSGSSCRIDVNFPQFPSVTPTEDSRRN
jgi:hypothetical protein